MSRQLPIIHKPVQIGRQPGRWPYVLESDLWLTFPTHFFGYSDLADKDSELWVRLRGRDFFVKAGYAWDGCSMVPTFKSTVIASCWHDASGQFRHLDCLAGYLDGRAWNRLFRQLIQAEGGRVVAPIYWLGLAIFNPAYQALGKLAGNKPTGKCLPPAS